MTFADILKGFRKYRNLTQKELADLVGISCSSIINYENGRRENPPYAVLARLAKVLNIDIHTFWAEDIVFEKKGYTIYYRGSDDTLWGDEVEESHPQDTMKKSRDDAIVQRLRSYVELLNNEGTAEAIKRVAELTEISKYRLDRK